MIEIGKKSVKKLIDSLYLGGVSRKTQERVYREIEEANRKSVVAYAGISMLAFIAMTLFATMVESDVSKNKIYYMAGTLVMAGLLVLNCTIAKKYRRIISISAYLFVIVILLIGILLAISGKDDITASYIVFLFVVPLLFILKPLYIILLIVGSDLLYIWCMYRVETSVLFGKNIINAVIYCFLSVFVSTTMIKMRIQKFETDDMNRILMETDQLTGMLNRRSFEQDIEKYKDPGSLAGVKICVFDVNGLKTVNDNIGHLTGDELLCGAGACLEKVFSQYGRCYRIGGDEFVAVLSGVVPSEEELLERLENETAVFTREHDLELSISVGMVNGTQENSMREALRDADGKMYESKAEYYKRKRTLHG